MTGILQHDRNIQECFLYFKSVPQITGVFYGSKGDSGYTREGFGFIIRYKWRGGGVVLCSAMMHYF